MSYFGFILKKQNGRFEIVNFLLQKGAIIDDIQNLFSAACEVCIFVFLFVLFFFCLNVKYDSVIVLIVYQGGNMEIVKLFLEMGAGPIDSFNDSNYSPLFKASKV